MRLAGIEGGRVAQVTHWGQSLSTARLTTSSRNVCQHIGDDVMGLGDGGNGLVISRSLRIGLSAAHIVAATGYYRLKSGNGH